MRSHWEESEGLYEEKEAPKVANFDEVRRHVAELLRNLKKLNEENRRLEEEIRKLRKSFKRRRYLYFLVGFLAGVFASVLVPR